MNLYHFYHVYADGDWLPAVSEHLTALKDSGLSDFLTNDMYVGFVGSPENIAAADEYMQSRINFTTIARRPAGWEQTTLIPLAKFAALNDGAYLYSHTKGAHDPSEINIAWRRSMTYDNVTCWRNCARLLGLHDAVGAHRIHEPHGNGYFGGNIWWARGEYLRTLPKISTKNRHEAEVWIAKNVENAKFFDVRPGWPGFDLFHKEGS